MWVIKKDDSVDAIVSKMLNIEHGAEVYDLSLNQIDSPKGIELQVGKMSFRCQTRIGFIYCILSDENVESLRTLKMMIEARLRDFSIDHLKRVVTRMSFGTYTVRTIDAPRRVITLNEDETGDFTWILSMMNESLFSSNLYFNMKQVSKCYSTILYDEDGLFTYDHGEFIQKVSASKMTIPVLPEPLTLAAQSMDSSQISVLINQDAYQIEFISLLNAMLCTRLRSVKLRPAGEVIWKKVRTKIVYQTACDRDCYICRFPIFDFGVVIKGIRVTKDAIQDDLMEIYCTFVDPIIGHFTDIHNKYILVCKHCMRIILHLSEAPVRFDYYTIYFDESKYKKVCEQSHMLSKYAFLLNSFEIGNESRAVKVNNQFYITNKRDYKTIFLGDSRIRSSRLPFMHVSMFFYNTISGYY